MAKSLSNQRFIFKLHTDRLKRAKWNLTLPLDKARENEELIALAESTTLRMIDNIVGQENKDRRIKAIKKEIKLLKREDNTRENRKRVGALYNELDSLQFIPHYMTLVIDKVKDYHLANKGFTINGTKYRRLLGTTGGVKNSTIVYVSEQVYPSLRKRLENGRNLTKKFVPAKLEAYRALACSSSVPVSTPKGILVVHDCETMFKADVIMLDDTDTDKPKMEFIKDHEVELTDSDGYGLILPSQMQLWALEIGEDYLPSGMCIRNAFTKGMVFPVDYIDFAKNVAHKEEVVDVWGNTHNINDIKMILTTSMLKLWDSYDSIDHYLACCEENGFTYSVTKVAPKELESERNLNYQFIQSYDFNDEQLDQLLSPTISLYKDIIGLDPYKSLLFLKGMNIQEEDFYREDFNDVRALMVNKELIKDPYIRAKIYNMLKRKIDQAKVGVIKVHGNFAIISGDVYSLMQHIFGMEVTGLLKSGEYYHKYWSDKGVDRVACFRAPMTSHNNIRLLNIKATDEMKHWYKYMETIAIFNAWDTSTHALNGADKDSDTVLTTDNPIIVNGTRELPAIMCVQRNATKVVPTEADTIISNINSFGDGIGTTTNRITSMFEIMSRFDKDSEEYKELDYRITCGQLFQQNAIDKAKGIISKPMPKEFYDYRTNKYESTDNEETTELKRFNLSILADKKPYFMTYIYPQARMDYKKFIEASNKKCLNIFGLEIQELQMVQNRTPEQEEFLYWYDYKMPVGISPCVMNKIAWKIEQAFDKTYKEEIYGEFDASILKSGIEYDKNLYYKIKKLFKEFNDSVRRVMVRQVSTRLDRGEAQAQIGILKEEFSKRVLSMCSNEKELCDIMVDVCYMENKSKQFVWEICGNVIVDNLLAKNSNQISFPIANEDGEINFNGKSFTIKTMEVK